MSRFLAELKRRKVFHTAAVYAVVAAGVWGAANDALPALGLPEAAVTFVVVATLLGFPVALVLAWFFEVRPEQPEAVREASEELPPPTRRRWGLLVGGVVAVAVATVGLLVVRPGGLRSAVLEGGAHIVLAHFDAPPELEGEAVALRRALITDLSESSYVTLLPDVSLALALLRMERNPSELLTADVARELALREGLAGSLEGDLTAVGDEALLSVRLVAPADGRVLLADEEMLAAGADRLEAIDRLSARLRDRIGESASSITASPPLPDVTTRSTEALALFDRAARTGGQERVSYLTEALALDSTFAIAHMLLGLTWRDGDQPARAVGPLTRAWELRDRVRPRERFEIEWAYHESVTGDREAARVAIRSALDRYPHTSHGVNFLGILDLYDGRFAAAEALFVRALELPAPDPNYRNYNLVAALMGQGRLDDALAAATEASPRVRYRLHMARREWAAADSVAETLGALARALVAGARGRLAEMARFRGEQIELVDRRGDAVASANVRVVGFASTDLFVRGDTAAALAAVAEILAAYPLPERPTQAAVEENLARLFAAAGRPERARHHLARFDEAAAGVPSWQLEKRRLEILGTTTVAEGRVEEGLRTLRTAVDAPIPPFGQFNTSIIALARAYDRAGLREDAVEQYERFAHASWLWGKNLLDSYHLAHAEERLGALQASLGNPEKAVAHYEAFVELWAEADPELQPRVKAAREALSRLGAEVGRDPEGSPGGAVDPGGDDGTGGGGPAP